MYSSLKQLVAADCNISVAVATVYSGSKLIKREVNGVTYWVVPLNGKSQIKYNSHLEPLWRDVRDDFKPDVVHIHGSEYPHGLAYVEACGSKGVVVSLQGIISRIARYYATGIDFRGIKKCLTLRGIVKNDDILKGQKSFEKRGRNEISLLQSVGHIIGRTDWDKAHAWAINPNAQYHYCGETLRDSFYNHKWSYDKCEHHSIFVSQASYPIKGLHKLLEAMPLVLREYPDAKIYVAGDDPTAKQWWCITGYGKYLRRLINKLGLRPYITFSGMLSEEDMCKAYLRANLFVCPSAIENSPNSLGEAQLLGMPYVASFVGGIPEIVEYNPTVLYRFEETEMLAKRICAVFEASEKFTLCKFDERRYDKIVNSELLRNIYQDIANQ